jgi:hypothetical protein
VRVIAEGMDPDIGRMLWEVSEELTGVEYGVTATNADVTSADR